MKKGKNIRLMALSVLVIALYFILPRNKEWITEKIVPYWNDFWTQHTHLDIETRRVERYKSPYVQSKQIAQYFNSYHPNEVVVILLPSSAYFKQHGFPFDVPEPAVFYYYTSIKTVTSHSPEVLQANWMITVRNGHLFYDSVINKQLLEDSIKSFNHFISL